jgi:transcription initiation factor TFIIIB Brf1 subunit/transcription initiation factor TFIIB
MNNNENMEQCEHLNVINSSCIDCGIMMDEFIGSGKSVKEKQVHKSIISNLEKLGFNEQIRNAANQIYLKLQTVTKKNDLPMLYFFCVFNACINTGTVEDPIKLAEKIGLPKNKIQKALNEFSNSSFKTPSILYTAIDLIPGFCESLNFNEDDIEGTVKLAQRLFLKAEDLMDESPRKIAGAIIQYYMSINGMSFNKKEFAKIIRLSDVTINNSYRKICELDNH